MRIIAIVGGGPSGISTLAQLVRKFIEEKQKDVRIYVIEKSGDFGPGLAYGTKDRAHIINLSAEHMSPIANDPQHFIKWTRTNPDKWKPEYPDIDLEKCSFPPRYLFGIYLRDLVSTIKKEAAAEGIYVSFLTNEVIDIKPMIQDGKKQLKLYLKDINLTADDVVLCIGHLSSSEYTQLKAYEGYYHSPWQTLAIPKDKAVVIIGTRLTAIDTALSLAASGHRGKITMVSRGGLLPTVIGPTEKYTRQFLTTEKLDEITGLGTRHQPLQLSEVLDLFWQELEHAEGEKFTTAQKEQIFNPKKSALDWLTEEIQAARSTTIRRWQSVLVSLYPIVTNIWSRLGPKDQKVFLEKYYSIWMTYLAAFPLENALRILQLLKNGQLEVVRGLRSVTYDSASAKFNIELAQENQKAIFQSQYVINAIGAGHDITKSDSVLLKNLLNARLIQPHPLGGINTDFRTLCAIDQNGKITNNFFVIGDATWGVFMATADLGQIGREVQRAVNILFENYLASPRKLILDTVETEEVTELDAQKENNNPPENQMTELLKKLKELEIGTGDADRLRVFI